MSKSTDTGLELITARRVREEKFDGRSDMWLWRKVNDPALNFPKPIYITGTRYFVVSEIDDWIERQRGRNGG